jgi:phosphatidylethanolamine-binding protein (PEBP) family uncharacterized protein
MVTFPRSIPARVKNISPPLAWEGVPYAHPKMVWVHWVVYNMLPDTNSVPENARKPGLPQGTLFGLNDFKKGVSADRSAQYFHKLYAVDWR